MKQSHLTLVIICVSVAIAVGGIVLLARGPKATPVNAGDNSALAQCLTDKGVKFYGASWCPHCAEQKALLGEEAMKKVTYVECALPDNPNDVAQVCKDAEIESFPTWTFPDGTRKTGIQQLNDLASQSGCPLK